MGILSNFAKSVLGLKGKTPQTFGVDPAGALHNQYSNAGTPNVKWRTISGEGMKPQPSKLDELDTQAPNLQRVGVVSQVYKSSTGRRYKDLGPTEGRY